MADLYMLVDKLCHLDEHNTLSSEETIHLLCCLLQFSEIWKKITLFALVFEEPHLFDEKLIHLSIKKKDILNETLSINQNNNYKNFIVDEEIFFLKFYSNIRALNNQSKPLSSFFFLAFEECTNEEFIYKLLKSLGRDTNIYRNQDYWFSANLTSNSFGPVCSQTRPTYCKVVPQKVNDVKLRNEIKQVIEKCDERHLLKFEDWNNNIISPYVNQAINLNIDNQEEVFEELKEINNINRFMPNYIGISLVRS